MTTETEQASAVKTPQDAALCAAIQTQQQIAEVQRELNKLEGLIADQERLIARHKAKQPDLAVLEQMREDMLAAEASGTTTTAERREFESKAESEEVQAANIATLIERSRKTVAGITRQAETLRGMLKKLRTEKATRVQAYVMAEAESIGLEYVRLAQELEARRQRLGGLRAIAVQLGAHSAFTIQREAPLEVPAFGLAACAGRLHLYTDHLIKSGTTDTGASAYQRGRAEMEQAWPKLGLQVAWEEFA